MKNNFEMIWGRIRQETPIKNFTELAEITGITQSGLSKAKARNDFSPTWAYLVGRKYGLLTEWIMTGEGPKNLDKKEDNLNFYRELEQWAEETAGSTQWIKNQINSFFPKFIEWKNDKRKNIELDGDIQRQANEFGEK